MPPLIPNPALDLWRAYWMENNPTRQEAAQRFGVGKATIDKWLHDMPVPHRKGGQPRKTRWIEIDREALTKLIEVDGMTIRQAAAALNQRKGTIEKRVAQWGIRCWPMSAQTGSRSHAWKGGRIVDKDGYILIYKPDHPRARKCGRPTPRYVLEHILVAEQKLGRPLADGEVVHHRNGIHYDNRPENLEVFATNADHLRHELTGRCPKWTPEGQARIAAAVAKSAANRRGKARDDSPSPQMSGPSTE